MITVKKVVENNKKYISLFGFKIPYETMQCQENRRITIMGISLFYRFDHERGVLFVKLCGKEIPLRVNFFTRRCKHYRMRKSLTDERCKELLIEELAPMLGYRPDLENPKTFNEKILWSKIHVREPLITTCCDKYALKTYASDIIGKEYVLPIIGAWERADDIDFDKLPDRFVLKVNWSSGFNIIVKDKEKLNTVQAVRQIQEWMKPEQNSYYDSFNWGYKNMKPVVFAEPYIEQIDGQVYDYKFYFSNGRFLYMFIATDRHGDHSLTYTFFDENFEYMPFTYGNKPNANPHPQMPKNLHKMLEMAKKLSEPFEFVRVDFYELSEYEFYLGEMTFYSGGGMLCFNPSEWDRILGDKITMHAKEA